MRRWARIACACIAATAPLSIRADEAPVQDTVVRALRDELARSVDHLQLPDAGKPYYMALRLQDQRTLAVGASFGALIFKNEQQVRHLRAEVRVGNYAIDNSNMGRGDVAFERLPLDDDYDVVRHDAWHALDSAYKQAASAYARKLAMRESLAQNSDEVDDFSREAPAHIVVKRDVPPVDAERASTLVKNLSTLAKKYSALQSSEVRLVGISGRQVVISSEDTFASENDAVVILGASLRTQASDGMPLSRFLSYAAPTLAGLPEPAQLAREFERAAEELTALRDAQPAQDYTGPVLFEATAAAQLVGFVMAQQFSGAPALKSQAMRGGSGAESELAGKIGQHVLPAGFSVVDDPTLDHWGATPLIGRSAADDEGMPAQRVVLVQDGVLQDFLMSRAPRKGFAHSNGHGHAAMNGAIRAGAANLIFTTNKPVSAAELTKKLLAEAKAAGQTYAVVVRLLDDPTTTGDFLSAMRRGASNVPPPLVLVKLTPDGKEQPLRGATFGQVSLAAFQDIVAAGQDSSVVLNRGAGSVCSVVAPALLLKRVEIRKPGDQQRKLPTLEHPSFVAKSP
jgi:predicted Zn-dependent protease